MELRLPLASNEWTGLLHLLRSSARPHSNNMKCSKPDTVLAPSSLPLEACLFHSRRSHPATSLHSQPLTPSSPISPLGGLHAAQEIPPATSADLTMSPGYWRVSSLALQDRTRLKPWPGPSHLCYPRLTLAFGFGEGTRERGLGICRVRTELYGHPHIRPPAWVRDRGKPSQMRWRGGA